MALLFVGGFCLECQGPFVVVHTTEAWATQPTGPRYCSEACARRARKRRYRHRERCRGCGAVGVYRLLCLTCGAAVAAVCGGKTRYREERAEDMARKIQAKHPRHGRLQAYWCPFCREYHIGHNPGLERWGPVLRERFELALAARMALSDDEAAEVLALWPASRVRKGKRRAGVGPDSKD